MSDEWLVMNPGELVEGMNLTVRSSENGPSIPLRVDHVERGENGTLTVTVTRTDVPPVDEDVWKMYRLGDEDA